MDGVLEEAVVLCACKLVCSLLFLPSLAASHSPISLCCCCLLVFTDFLVAALLGFLCICEPWMMDQTPQGDIIALRFLLFLSHTYGMVLLLTVPLIAVEILTGLLMSRFAAKRCCVGEENTEKEKQEKDTDKDKRPSHIVSYFCCLSVWAIVALNFSCRWRLEEARASACLHATNSLIRCLPNLLCPMPSSMNLFWSMAFLLFIMLILTTSISLDGGHQDPAWTETEKHRGKSGIRNSTDSCWQELTPILSEHGTSVPEAAPCVDPEKTESSCNVHRVYSWNSVQMSTSNHGEFVLIPPDFISAGKGRTKKGILLTFTAEDHVDWENRSRFLLRQRDFPCPGVNVMIGFMGALSIFVLPLTLSVNIFLIRTIEVLLELCIKSLVSLGENKNNTSDSHNKTLV
ncbi:uncharacterized protein LOC121507070 [Cheilinus undulatus]|uniref:uncharacterized protein LOC121507070 n=1 Tax=Cheilinus undulatus TaxID=241271 RepID=UPI001BD3E6AF|nr:uncharacterized protein LOC121507070 [Cheilinus undulatus]